MLDEDYKKQFNQVVDQTEFAIELPAQWQNYFAERGEIPSFADDKRGSQRLKVRTHGLMWFEKSLPFLSRQPGVRGVYTKDFSRHGVGVLCDTQLFPEEQLRILLPTFWIRVRVVRARRLTSRCYEIGNELIERLDPCEEAFDMLNDVALTP